MFFDNILGHRVLRGQNNDTLSQQASKLLGSLLLPLTSVSGICYWTQCDCDLHFVHLFFAIRFLISPM